MTTHQQARQYASDAIARHYGRPATLLETKGLAGVACLETTYGDGWKGNGKGSFNMVAAQCGSGWRGASFSYTDTHPNPDGTSTAYPADFRSYASVEDGWDDAVRTVFVNRGRDAARSSAAAGDWFGMSKWLHTSGFYEGYGKTVADRIANHHRALVGAISRADAVPKPVIVVPSMPPTLRMGDRGEAVKLMQRELRVAADGEFGPITSRALRAAQTGYGLSADGVCGPLTWAKLFGDDYRPETK